MGHPFSGKSLIKILHSWIGKRRQETDFDKDKRKKTQKRWSRPEKVLVAIKIVWSPFHFPHLWKGKNKLFLMKLFLVEKMRSIFFSPHLDVFQRPHQRWTKVWTTLLRHLQNKKILALHCIQASSLHHQVLVLHNSWSPAKYIVNRNISIIQTNNHLLVWQC